MRKQKELTKNQIAAYELKKANPDFTAKQIVEAMGLAVDRNTVGRWIRKVSRRHGVPNPGRGSTKKELTKQEIAAYELKKANPDFTTQQIVNALGLAVDRDTVGRWLRKVCKRYGVTMPGDKRYIYIDPHKPRPRVMDIIIDESKKTLIPVEELISKKRNRHIVAARQHAIWRARRETGRSLSEIGRVFNLDHSTILHACVKIEGLISNEKRS